MPTVHTRVMRATGPLTTPAGTRLAALARLGRTAGREVPAVTWVVEDHAGTPAAAVPVAVECVVECDGYHVHRYETASPRVRIIHDYMSWDPETTVDVDPLTHGQRWGTGAHRSYFPDVQAAFAALLPGVPVPSVTCHNTIGA